jgi:hypothetical protein
MKYLEKSFVVLYGSKEYRNGWDMIFGNKDENNLRYEKGKQDALNKLAPTDLDSDYMKGYIDFVNYRS